MYYSADFSAQNGSAYLNRNALPVHGLGNVTVSTAGRHLARALALNSCALNVDGHLPWATWRSIGQRANCG